NVDADSVQARFALQVNQLSSDGSLGAWLDPADSKLFPIAEGDGASKSIGRIRLSVFRHFTKTTTLDYARLFDLSTAHALNSASVTLPPLYRGSQNLIFAQGQLMYTGFKAQLVGNLLQVEHSLDAASDFYARWAIIDAKGKQVDAYAGRLHDFKDFSDLF
ncbi:MAG: hypothetical protein EBZ59_10490, partial [Planctomycetia bacterium]|nr:hypothetical protein [Planctomycetia bacterium]